MKNSYTIFIADDEIPILKELESLDWGSVGVKIIGTATNGEEVIKFCAKNPPDILLLDIEMPILDGLHVASFIKKSNINSKIIFLTCHQKFDYAKEALDMGASGYIIKSLQMEKELFPLIQKICDEIREETKILKYLKENQIKKETLEALQNDKQSCLDKLLKFPFCMRLISLTTEVDRNDFELRATPLFINKDVLFIRITEYKYILISENNDADLKKLLLQALNEMEIEQIYITDNIIINNANEYMESMKRFMNMGILLFYEEKNKIDLKCVPTYYSQSIKETNENKIIELISNKEWDILKSFCIKNFIHPCIIKNEIIKITQRHSDRFEENFIQMIQLSDTFSEVIDIYCSAIDMTKEKNIRIEIVKAMTYIKDNYNQDISLSEVANFVDISPDYLSKLMKKEMGVTFLQYLNSIRIEKAIYLLEHTNQKVYEVAEHIGIDSYRYFLILFKKITGKNPTDYQIK